MADKIKKIALVLSLTLVILVIFMGTNYNMKKINEKDASLVIYGENIKTEYAPFIQDGGIYLSIDTISKTIDEEIFYDKIATKVIVTGKKDVIKFKIDENKISKNMEYSDISTAAKLVNNQPFVDINLLKEIYNIKIEYNEKTNTISIDKKSTSDISVKYNKVFVYSDINAKSDVLQIISRNETVTLYKDSLNHNRWYKIKTDSGVVGYISKNNIENINAISENIDENNIENEEDSNSKLTMFWQYGSDLNVLEKNKIDGVDVVSPTWYELKNSNGEISSNFNKDYYSQAKSLGYKIWPIITNGIDSVSYSPTDTSAMLNSEYNREQFIKNLLQICKTNGLDGINIDFEAMKTEDKDMYTQFIKELTPILRRENITVSVDMYFVAYIDRKAVGKVVDYVVLMGYDQRGAWSSDAGSISEVSWVEKNISSLINDSKIPSEKIILGVPFYTRLWTIKNGQEKPTTKVYTMKDCEDFITTNNLTKIWDEDAGQNYVEYKKGDTTNKLWIEDKDSIKKRVETVNKFNLGGITAWRKGFETAGTFDVIKNNINK